MGSDAAAAAAQAAISAQSHVDLNDGEIDSSVNSAMEEGINSAVQAMSLPSFFPFATSAI